MRVENIPGRGGHAIPTRIWDTPPAATHPPIPIVMTHGLQSHSAWFSRSQAFLSGLGLPVYAFDRRGSGLSTEPRGDCASFGEMVDDVLAVADRAHKDYGAERVHVFGHCFGALPATAFACMHPARAQTLVLATPGLFTKSDLRLSEKLRVFASVATGRATRLPVPLEAEMFSELPEHVRFIREDPLSLPDASARFFFSVFQVRRFLARASRALELPVLMACAGQDEICDNARNRRFLESLPSPAKRLVEYPTAKHILEWSGARDAFFADLRNWFGTEGRA
jgi:alpha-beta hydrolase superfamily lysophospholipase